SRCDSIHDLRLGERPGAIQNLGTRPIEAFGINPALRDRQTYDSCILTAAHPAAQRADVALHHGGVANRIGVNLVRLEISRGVVIGACNHSRASGTAENWEWSRRARQTGWAPSRLRSSSR